MAVAKHFERRIQLAQEEVDSWKRDYDAAQCVWDLEAAFRELMGLVDDMFSMDERIHLGAAKSGDAELLNEWTKEFVKLAGRHLELTGKFREAAKKADTAAYRDCVIRLGDLDSYEKRLWEVVAPSDEYLKRGDVDGAIKTSEEQYRAGNYESDNVASS